MRFGVCLARLSAHVALWQHPRYNRVFTPDLFDPRDPVVPWFSPVVGVAGVIMRAVLVGFTLIALLPPMMDF